jgi:hypothetical protein
MRFFGQAIDDCVRFNIMLISGQCKRALRGSIYYIGMEQVKHGRYCRRCGQQTYCQPRRYSQFVRVPRRLIRRWLGALLRLRQKMRYGGQMTAARGIY